MALWQAAKDWQRRFNGQMQAQGFAVFAEAASGILAYVGPDGVRQSLLAPRMGLTKQAAQQFVDRLQVLDLIARVRDPDDARGWVVVLTEAGKAMMTKANTVKRGLEEEYRRVLGPEDFNAMKRALDRLSP